MRSPSNVFGRFGERTAQLASCWHQFEDLWRDTINAALWHRFEPFIAAHLDEKLSDWRDRLSSNFAPIYRSGDLYSRTKEYSLPPHRDGQWYLLTCLMYFPRDNSRENLGTQLFEVAASRCLPTQAHSIEEAKRLPYQRNSLLVFLNNHLTFHGNPPIGECRRDIYIHYISL